MKAHGNSAPEQCAANLLHISRGEIPYSRCKGRSTDVIDAPAPGALAAAAADAARIIEIYEPRVQADSINIKEIIAASGDFGIDASIHKSRKEDSE